MLFKKSLGIKNTFTVLIENNLCISGPMQFKPVLFKGQLYLCMYVHMYIHTYYFPALANERA